MGIGAEIADLAIGTASNVYNLYNQYKMQQYNKNLQKQIFAREDNAIQRQVADAEKAGFNRFAVMGNNGAGAGSVVSVTPPQSEDMSGKLFDTLNAGAQLSVNRSSAKIAKANAVKAESDAKTAVKANEAYQAQIASEMVKILRENGVQASFSFMNGRPGYGWTGKPDLDPAPRFEDTPAGQEFHNYYSQQSSKTSILETDERYRDAKAIADLIGTILGGGSSAVNAASNAYKARRGLKK